jgi:hypothetical protein
MYGGGCVFVWEFDDPGWIRAMRITEAAAHAMIAGTEDEPEGRETLARWRVLVGEPGRRSTHKGPGPGAHTR